MIKFGRKYRLTIQMTQSEDAIVIEPPFSLFFNINRSTMATVNDASIQIYNLSKQTRDLIFQDWFNQAVYRRVILEAGYGDKLNVIFSGNLFRAQSRRNGADIITELYAFDGGFDTYRTQSHITLAAGTKQSDLAKTLISDFAQVKLGAITENAMNTVFKRPVSVSGNTYQNMLKYFDKEFFIDNEVAHVLGTSDILDVGDIPVLSAENGLLESPIREDARLSAKMLFMPDIQIGQAAELNAKVMTNYNGQFKVIGIRHVGLISEAIGGDCYTQIDLLLPNLIGGSALNVVTQ